jgi:hypothetical protein
MVVVPVSAFFYCHLALWPTPQMRPKSQNFNIGYDYAPWLRNFMVVMKKPENLDFETWPNGHNLAKIQNSNIRHDGIRSIGNFMLMTFSTAR